MWDQLTELAHEARHLKLTEWKKLNTEDFPRFLMEVLQVMKDVFV